MRHIQLLTVLVLSTLAVSAFGFDSDDLNRLTVTNQTGKTIQYLFISPGDSADWGPDMLGQDVLSNRANVTYYMLYQGRTGEFDIMAIDADNQRYEVRKFTLTNGSVGRVTINASNKTTVEAPDLVNVTLENVTGYEMKYVFFSPADSSSYGADILGSETTLTNDSSHTFAILKPDSDVKYDFMGIDEDNDKYTFQVTIRSNQTDVPVKIEISDLDTSE